MKMLCLRLRRVLVVLVGGKVPLFQGEQVEGSEASRLCRVTGDGFARSDLFAN